MASLWRWTVHVLALVSVGTLLACGNGSGTPGGTTPDPDPEPAPFGLTQRTPLGALGFPTGAATPRPVDLDRAFSNLSFTRPIWFGAVQAPDGSFWLIVVEQGGRIYAFRNDDNVQVAGRHLVMDISAGNAGPVSRATDEEGLLGIAFDPAFAETGNTHFGRFYVHYSAASPRRSVIARYTATFTGTDNAPVANPNTFESILEVNQPFSNHNAGSLEFGADGYLYIAMGDGGSGGDPQGNGQNLTTLLGSMLRIDPRNPPAGETYAIPADNPFLGTPTAAPEAWAYGLRNPWRFSFDRNTGELWLGDVGQITREEVNIVRAGDNLGWDRWEGNSQHEGNEPAANFVPPVIDYPRGDGNIVVGGIVYRGVDVPSLSGAYVYGDHGSNTIWALVPDGDRSFSSNTVIQSLNNVVSFGEDENAELYAVSLNGGIFRVAEPVGGPPPPPPFPDLLSETLLFTDLVNLTPAAGLLEYDVNSELWSDGSRKRRWIGVPGNTRIDFDATQPWTFPDGTVLVKHFELLLDVQNPASAHRLETRVLIREAGAWSGYTYRWNAQQTDADLLPGSFCESFTIQDPAAPGGQRTQMWRYPSRSECFQCHTDAAGTILGVRTGQLHGDFDFAEATDNQLRTWNHIGMFTQDIGDAAQYEAWPDPADAAQGTLATRARAYIAANCAQCHLPGGPAPGSLDFRYTTPTGQMNAVDRRPLQGDFGLGDPWIIRSGVKEDSVLWLRVGTTAPGRMPALGSLEVHTAAVDLLGAWIDAGP